MCYVYISRGKYSTATLTSPCLLKKLCPDCDLPKSFLYEVAHYYVDSKQSCHPAQNESRHPSNQANQATKEPSSSQSGNKLISQPINKPSASTTANVLIRFCTSARKVFVRQYVSRNPWILCLQAQWFSKTCGVVCFAGT